MAVPSHSATCHAHMPTCKPHIPTCPLDMPTCPHAHMPTCPPAMCLSQVDVLARESGSHVLDTESESDDDGDAIVLEPVELIYEGYQDPEATVALVFGGSSDWQLLAESLHALVDVLHTAPLCAAAEQTGGAAGWLRVCCVPVLHCSSCQLHMLRAAAGQQQRCWLCVLWCTACSVSAAHSDVGCSERLLQLWFPCSQHHPHGPLHPHQQALTPAVSASSDAEASGDGAEQQQQQQQRQGLTAELYYVDDSMVTWQVPLATVLSSTPAELANRAVAEGTALGSLSDLGQRAAAAGSVVLPVLHGSAAFAANVVSELSKAGAALAASPAEALRLAGDKWRLMERLQQLGFPTLPTFRMASEDAVSEDSLQQWQASFLEFCSKLGWDHEVQVFVVKPAKGTLGSAVTPAKGTDRASLAARIMLQRGMDDTVVIEPYMRDDVQFSCTVLDTPDGPVALMPTEIELYDIEMELYRHKLELFQWEMEQQGFPQEVRPGGGRAVVLVGG
jgi:D-alanine-D-alanine ligase-like ATP-grasp enzyme